MLSALEIPSLRWADVTQESPLRVKYASEPALSITPTFLGPRPSVGYKVLTVRWGTRIVVLGSNEEVGSLVKVTNWAKGDGSTNDTAAIQSAITAANGKKTVYFPPGTYMVNGAVGVQLNIANTRLQLASGAIIKVIPNNLTNYSILNVTSPDCTIEGGTVEGDVTTHTGSTGEWGHGINVHVNAHRTKIRDVLVKRCWGDGIYIGGDGAVQDVMLSRVTCDANRRNGCSVIGGTRFVANDCRFINTGTLGFTAPGAGIDLEPNSSGYNILEFQVQGCIANNNTGPGISIVRATGMTVRGKVNDCTMTANLTYGLLITGGAGSIAASVNGCTMSYNTLGGSYLGAPGGKLQSCHLYSNARNGVWAVAAVEMTGCVLGFNSWSGVLLDTGSDNSTIVGSVIGTSGGAAATTYHELDIKSTGLRMAGSELRPSASGNRAINAINVQATATGAVFNGVGASAGTVGKIAAQADTVQSPDIT